AIHSLPLSVQRKLDWHGCSPRIAWSIVHTVRTQKTQKCSLTRLLMGLVEARSVSVGQVMEQTARMKLRAGGNVFEMVCKENKCEGGKCRQSQVEKKLGF